MIEFKNLSGKRVRYGAYKKLYKKIFYKSGNSFWLSAVFAPPSLMRRLNKKYRGKNKPANVLSFLLEKNLPGRQTGTGEIFLNAKEKNLALRSAIAATANAQIVESHGHVLGAKTQLPIVAESSLENAGKTSDVRKFLVSVGLEKELQKASVSRTPLSGVAGRRSGGHAQKKSVLIIYGTPGAAISKAGRNLAGVDCASVDELNAALLAPGGSAGRLCVWTQGALDKLAKENLYL